MHFCKQHCQDLKSDWINSDWWKFMYVNIHYDTLYLGLLDKRQKSYDPGHIGTFYSGYSCQLWSLTDVLILPQKWLVVNRFYRKLSLKQQLNILRCSTCDALLIRAFPEVKMLEASSSLRFVGHPKLKSDNTANLNRFMQSLRKRKAYLLSPSEKRQCHSTGALRPLIFIIKDNYVTFISPLPALRGSSKSQFNVPQLSPLYCVQFTGLNRTGRFPLIVPLPPPNP